MFKLCAKHCLCSVFFMCADWYNSDNRLREVNSFAKGHTASKRQILTQVCLIPLPDSLPETTTKWMQSTPLEFLLPLFPSSTHPNGHNYQKGQRSKWLSSWKPRKDWETTTDQRWLGNVIAKCNGVLDYKKDFSEETGEIQIKAVVCCCNSWVLMGLPFSLLLPCNPFSCCFLDHLSKARIWPWLSLSPAYYLSVASPHPQGKDQALRVSFQLPCPASPLTSPPCLLVSAPTLLNVWLFSENARPLPASGPLLDTCQLHTPWPAARIVDRSLSGLSWDAFLPESPACCPHSHAWAPVTPCLASAPIIALLILNQIRII